MQNYPTKKRLAFTLIELIGVIAIIAILAAFLIPRIIDVIRDAAVSQTIGAINNVRSATATYISQNGSCPLVSNFDSNLVSANVLDKLFTTKLTTTADISVVAGSATSTDPGYFNLAGVVPAASSTTSADKVVIATLTGVSYRDAKKLVELVDNNLSWNGSYSSGKVKTTASGTAYDVTIYVTQ